MVVIDHARFLHMRFDLVVRYYLLEKHGFDAWKARASVMEDGRYKRLKRAFAELLKLDVAEKTRVRTKVKKAKVSEESYGAHVATNLFAMKSWSWIEERMDEGNEWIRKNPYPVRYNGLGTSVKRFLLALKHGRILYWRFGGDRTQLRLWQQNEYERLLKPSAYRDIEGAKGRMMDRMGELRFFSINDHVRNEGISREKKNARHI